MGNVFAQAPWTKALPTRVAVLKHSGVVSGENSHPNVQNVRGNSSGISTMRRVDSSRLKIPSARDCHPCLRNDLLPMSPE